MACLRGQDALKHNSHDEFALIPELSPASSNKDDKTPGTCFFGTVAMTQKSRLKWQCRRGMRELDLLLEGYLKDNYEALDSTDREGFERLLKCSNADLMDWLIEGDSPQDEQLAKILRKIRERMIAGA